MYYESPRIRSLLRQAKRVTEAGKRAAAEKLYRPIVEEDPESAVAWAGLATVVTDPEEASAARRRAMALDPNVQIQETEEKSAGAEAGVIEPKDAAVSSTESDHNSKVVDSSNPTLRNGRPQDAGDQGAAAVTTERITSDASSSQVTQPRDSNHHQHASDLSDVVVSEEVLYCANHPNRETYLRCNRCGKPMCSSCAKPTPVGYRCPECIREQEDVFYSARPLDYILAAVVSLPLSLAAGTLASLFGFWAIFVAAIAGSLVGRIAFRVAGRRRGRGLPEMVGAIVVIGGILPALPAILSIFVGGFSLQLIWTGLYILIAASATYYQMK